MKLKIYEVHSLGEEHSRGRLGHIKGTLPGYARASIFRMCHKPPAAFVLLFYSPRIVEGVAVSSSRESSPPRDRTPVSCNGRWVLYHWVPGKLHVSAVLIHIFINDAIANAPEHRSQHESLIRKVKLIPIAEILNKRIWTLKELWWTIPKQYTGF